MTKLSQEHARVTALTDTQLLSIGVTGKAKQAYARLLLDTIDALANPLRHMPPLGEGLPLPPNGDVSESENLSCVSTFSSSTDGRAISKKVIDGEYPYEAVSFSEVSRLAGNKDDSLQDRKAGAEVNRVTSESASECRTWIGLITGDEYCDDRRGLEPSPRIESGYQAPPTEFTFPTESLGQGDHPLSCGNAELNCGGSKIKRNGIGDSHTSKPSGVTAIASEAPLSGGQTTDDNRELYEERELDNYPPDFPNDSLRGFYDEETRDGWYNR